MKRPGIVNEPESEIVPPQPDDDQGPEAENIPRLGAPPVSGVPKPVTETLLAVTAKVMVFTGPIVPFLQVKAGGGVSV